jgi:hypothetical protein
MKTIRHNPRSRHQVLHVETEGGIVNITVGLADVQGRRRSAKGPHAGSGMAVFRPSLSVPPLLALSVGCLVPRPGIAGSCDEGRTNGRIRPAAIYTTTASSTTTRSSAWP